MSGRTPTRETPARTAPAIIVYDDTEQVGFRGPAKVIRQKSEEPSILNPCQQHADPQLASCAFAHRQMPFRAGPREDCSPCFMVASTVASPDMHHCSGPPVESHIPLHHPGMGCWSADQSWAFPHPVAKETKSSGRFSGAADSSSSGGEVASDSREVGQQPVVEAHEVESSHEASAGGVDASRGKNTRRFIHTSVPKNKDMASLGEQVEKDKVTTLMVRNIPNMYTKIMLMEELESLGFENDYDFLYLPIDKSTQWNVGYAFINFKTPEAARRCVMDITDYMFKRDGHRSRKVAQVSVAYIQGLEKNLEYYSKTTVQRARVNDHRPHFVSEGRQDVPEACGGSQNRHRGSGLRRSRRGKLFP